MTLREWAINWPYAVQDWNDDGIKWTPDSALVGAHRIEAWHLTDYRVTSVSGGTIWFATRENKS